MEGAALSYFPYVRSMLQKITQIDKEYYPEVLGHVIIINAPMLFTAVWAIVKRFLDAKTISKIRIIGANYQSALDEWIPTNNLPVRYGGTCTCEEGCQLSDRGPWNDGSLQDYPKQPWEGFANRDRAAKASEH